MNLTELELVKAQHGFGGADVDAEMASAGDGDDFRLDRHHERLENTGIMRTIDVAQESAAASKASMNRDMKRQVPWMAS